MVSERRRSIGILVLLVSSTSLSQTVQRIQQFSIEVFLLFEAKAAKSRLKQQCRQVVISFFVKVLSLQQQPNHEKEIGARCCVFNGSVADPRCRFCANRAKRSGFLLTVVRVALGRKKQAASKGIETVEETKTMIGESKEVVATINKPSVCVVASGEKRPATVPKGPNFHSIHVPKSCTKRVASQV